MTFTKGDKVRYTQAPYDRKAKNTPLHTIDGEFLTMATEKYATVRFPGNKVQRVLVTRLSKLEEKE